MECATLKSGFKDQKKNWISVFHTLSHNPRFCMYYTSHIRIELPNADVNSQMSWGGVFCNALHRSLMHRLVSEMNTALDEWEMACTMPSWHRMNSFTCCFCLRWGWRFDCLLTSTNNFPSFLWRRNDHRNIKFLVTQNCDAFCESRGWPLAWFPFLNCSDTPYKFASIALQPRSSKRHQNNSSLSIWPAGFQSSALS